jgi:hypothetical protein
MDCPGMDGGLLDSDLLLKSFDSLLLLKDEDHVSFMQRINRIYKLLTGMVNLDFLIPSVSKVLCFSI